jgi:hypothetical protein
VRERNKKKYGESADQSIIEIITKKLGLAFPEVW